MTIDMTADDGARRLERTLVLIRWFGFAFGVLLVLVIPPEGTAELPAPSDAALRAATWLLLLLGVGNVVIMVALARIRTPSALRHLGLAAFALDAVVVLGQTWAFSDHPLDSTWVVAYIVPLEGALRYGLAGALGVMTVAALSESIREFWLAHRFPLHEVTLDTLLFKPGVGFIIALVAGVTARGLAQEARRAREEAQRSAEAARREAAARRETAAFNAVILAGIEPGDLDASLARMVAATKRDLGFDAVAILLADGHELVAAAASGIQAELLGTRVAFGDGVVGRAAQGGQPILVRDVREDPSYIEVNPDVRTNLAVPMVVGDELLGVLDLESADVDAFDAVTVDLAERLAGQLAIVVQNATLRAQERLTVHRLRELDDIKSDFLAIVNHELRTPVAAVQGFLHLLAESRDSLSSEEVDEFIAKAHHRAAELARLVDVILEASAIADRGVEVRRDELALGAVIEESLARLHERERARVEVSVTEGERTVVTDPYHVREIVYRLTHNALKYSGEDSPVGVDVRSDGDVLRIAVHDEGIGIEAALLPTLFEGFRQGERAIRRRADGLGMGLYITSKLVDALGGRIEVSSELGTGSTFAVEIPVKSSRPMASEATVRGV